MTRIREMIQARAGQRKRGADLTQAMFYALIAIVLLISVLGLYQVVSLNGNKNIATRTMSVVSSEARNLFRNRGDFTGLDSADLVEAGAVPTDAIDAGETAAPTDDTIALPYNGTANFGASATGNNFDAVVTFAGNSRASRALCRYLSDGEAGVIANGPMGSEYSINGTPACAAGSPLTFRVTYQR